MKKIIISFIGTIVCATSFAQTFSGGNGSESEPYQISSTEDLDALNALIDLPGSDGKYFILTQDITEPYTKYLGAEYAFSGHFDGNNHSITVNINCPEESYVGLFGCVINGSVRNLIVKGNVVGLTNVAGIVGNPSNGAVLENLINCASVTGTSSSLLSNVGGVAGGIVSVSRYGTTGCTVKNCVNLGTIVGAGSCVGGVIGYSGQQVGNTLTALANYGNVISNSPMPQRVAGAIGNPMWDDKVHQIANFGIISSPSIAGCLGNANPEDQGELIYDAQYSLTDIVFPTQAKLTSQVIGSQLSTVFEANLWLFEDNLLPRPKMNGLENSDMMKLYATPIILDAKERLDSICSDFKVVIDNGVKWASVNGNIKIDADGTAHPLKGGNDILSATFGGYTHRLNVTVYETGSVNSVIADDNSPKEYFDILGRKVTNPQSGNIYIIRQGTKTSRILFRN